LSYIDARAPKLHGYETYATFQDTSMEQNVTVSSQSMPMTLHFAILEFSCPDIARLINLGTQHDGRSARTWMKRFLTTFVSLWEGEKDLLESTKMDF